MCLPYVTSCCLSLFPHEKFYYTPHFFFIFSREICHKKTFRGDQEIFFSCLSLSLLFLSVRSFFIGVFDYGSTFSCWSLDDNNVCLIIHLCSNGSKHSNGGTLLLFYYCCRFGNGPTFVKQGTFLGWGQQ